MRIRRLSLASLLAWFLPAAVFAQPVELPPARPDGPTNNAVLLPPQTFEDTAKTPNHHRERNGQWSISGGAYFLQPVFDSNAAFLVNTAAGNVVRQADFSHNLDVAPAAWLGYVSERGWGARARWFEFNHGTGIGYAVSPGETITGVSPLALGRIPVAGSIVASSNLAVNVADFQATCNLDGPKWSHILGIGVRYTHMSQDYRASLFGPGTRIDLTSGHNLNGAGPSLSLETKRRIGESGFGIYGQGHGAILFGHANEIYTAVNNGIPQLFSRDENRVLPVAELEIGGELEKNAGRARLFFQAGFVGQVWWNGGNASNLDPIGPTSASRSTFGFLGLVLRAGARF